MSKPFEEARSHRLLYANSHRAVTAIGRIAGGVRVYGQENIPDEGGALIAANHRHWTDILVLPSAVPERHVTMVARHDVLESGLQGAYFRALGAIPVHRGEPTREEFRALIETAKEGRLEALFPEETRDKERAKARGHVDMKEFKPGIARIARKAGVVTVPAALLGMDRKFTYHRGVAFGEPLEPPDDREQEAQWIDELRHQIDLLYIKMNTRQL